MSLHVIEVRIEMSVSMPDNKHGEILKDFRETIQGNATIEDVVKHIAWTMARDRYTGNDFVEGIGSLSEQGISCEEEYEDISIE